MHGRAVFFRTGTNSCGSCHRVQGQGQWIGPDLSTIGTKYGKDELLRSILNPSEAQPGYSFAAQSRRGSNDGRVLTGLPVEDGPERLVLKNAEGQRVAIRPGDVEDRKSSDLSLMPEGLAQRRRATRTWSTCWPSSRACASRSASWVSTMRSGRWRSRTARSLSTPSTRSTSRRACVVPRGRSSHGGGLDADAESLADLTTLAGSAPTRAVYVYAPVISPIEQDARIVLDTKADIKVWVGGKPLDVSRPSDDGTVARFVTLPKGSSDLLIRVAGGPGATLVTTFVSSRPLAFRGDEARVPQR